MSSKPEPKTSSIKIHISAIENAAFAARHKGLSKAYVDNNISTEMFDNLVKHFSVFSFSLIQGIKLKRKGSLIEICWQTPY